LKIEMAAELETGTGSCFFKSSSELVSTLVIVAGLSAQYEKKETLYEIH